MGQNIEITVEEKTVPAETTKKPDNQREQEFLQRNFSRALDTLAKTYIIRNCTEDRNVPLKDLVNCIERIIIQSALLVTRGNQKKAAAILGVKQTCLCEKMKRLNMRAGDKDNPFKTLQMDSWIASGDGTRSVVNNN